MDEKRNDLWKFVSSRTGRLAHMHEAGYTSGDLARLRTGVGLKPGDSPSATGIVIDGMPESIMSSTGKPTPGEWAAYTAITLYALHQRGHSRSVIVYKQSLGTAYRIALRGTADAEQVFSKKMAELGKTYDIHHLAIKLKTVISWLSSKGTGLDYAELATDLFDWQTPAGRGKVLVRWAQDFNRSKNKPEPAEKKA